jgi:hypothetical protein
MQKTFVILSMLILLFGCGDQKTIPVSSNLGHSNEANCLCINGVTYIDYGFNGGIAPLFNIDGSLVPCDN